MKILKMLKPFAHIYVATVVLIVGCKLFSLEVFAVTSAHGTALGTASLALRLTAIAWIMYMAFTISIIIVMDQCLSIPLKQPGILLATLIGVVAGAAAIHAEGFIIPGTVLIKGMWAATPYAFANTIMIWIFAYATGSLQKNLTFLPH